MSTSSTSLDDAFRPPGEKGDGGDQGSDDEIQISFSETAIGGGFAGK